MSKTDDGYDDLTADPRDDDLRSDNTGASAALAVVVTLLLGCGLVFAAYKLGQRTVDDVPTLVADNDTPIRQQPADPGGTPIPNTDNDAYRMIDRENRSSSPYVIRDGIVVAQDVPSRDLGAANSLQANELRSEIVDLGDIPTATSIDGEPDLTPGEVPDRRDERLLAGRAEVVAPGDELALALAENGESGAVEGEGDIGITVTEVEPVEVPRNAPPRTDAQETGTPGETLSPDGVAGRAEPAQPERPSLVMRVPPRKPSSLGQQAAAAPASARNRTADPSRDTGASDAPRRNTQIALAPAAPPQPPSRTARPETRTDVPTAGPRNVVIPPQPPGDAQVQLGALPSPEQVRAKWAVLKTQNTDLLGQLGLQVLPVATADGQRLYRLRVGPLNDGQTAARLCDQLRYRGVDCFVPARR